MGRYGPRCPRVCPGSGSSGFWPANAANETRPAARTAIKDDAKIIAQGVVREAAWIITDDADTLYKWAQKLFTDGRSKMRPIKLDDGFNPAFFEPDGQLKMEYDPSREQDQEGT